MRTETRTYTLYRITELSEEAKEKAHNEWLCNRYFYGWTHENRQTLDTFLDTLHTEEDCREYLEDMRWHGELVCLHCGSTYLSTTIN